MLPDFVPNCKLLNRDFYINSILKQLEISNDSYKAKKMKKIVYLHFENAPSHSSKDLKQYLDSSLCAKVTHFPYFPDLSSYDFAINGALKDCLESCYINLEKEIFSSIKNFLFRNLLNFGKTFSIDG